MTKKERKHEKERTTTTMERSSSHQNDPSLFNVPSSDQDEGPDKNIPRSFIIKDGNISRIAQSLEHDLRRMMGPETSLRLKELRGNKLADFVRMASIYGISHFFILTQTEEYTNLRLCKFPQGPTLYFRIEAFSLIRDICQSLSHPPTSSMIDKALLSFPILILNNFNIDNPEGKLLCSMIQGLFPSIDTEKIELHMVKRLILFHFNQEEKIEGDEDKHEIEDGNDNKKENSKQGTIEIRHYLVNVKTVGLSRPIKKITNSYIPDLSMVKDISDFLLKQDGLNGFSSASESELDPETSMITTTFPSDKHEYEMRNPNNPNNPNDSDDNANDACDNKKGNTKSPLRKAVRLTEIGPRMTWRLRKIVDGFNSGNLLYHFK